MSEQKHSPLPWRVGVEGYVVDANGISVADFDTAIYAAPVEENSSLAVRAVNSHSALVSIVRVLVEDGILCYVDDDYEDLSSGRPGMKVTEEGLGLLFRARKALELAGETE